MPQSSEAGPRRLLTVVGILIGGARGLPNGRLHHVDLGRDQAQQCPEVFKGN